MSATSYANRKLQNMLFLMRSIQFFL